MIGIGTFAACRKRNRSNREGEELPGCTKRRRNLETGIFAQRQNKMTCPDIHFVTGLGSAGGALLESTLNGNRFLELC